MGRGGAEDGGARFSANGPPPLPPRSLERGPAWQHNGNSTGVVERMQRRCSACPLSSPPPPCSPAAPCQLSSWIRWKQRRRQRLPRSAAWRSPGRVEEAVAEAAAAGHALGLADGLAQGRAQAAECPVCMRAAKGARLALCGHVLCRGCAAPVPHGRCPFCQTRVTAVRTHLFMTCHSIPT